MLHNDIVIDSTKHALVRPLTAIVCAHNPRDEHLKPTLSGLAAQQGLPDGSEFVLIDNASEPPLGARVDLSTLTNFSSARIVREDRLGLTNARIRSFYEAHGDIFVFIDDDNILEPDYLSQVMTAFASDPKLGALGGKSIPRYAMPPPAWFAELGIGLACRDLGDRHLSAAWESNTPRTYPECAPIGAGMGIRREALAPWIKAVTGSGVRNSLGRRGADLASGEDNDMILTVLDAGWTVSYQPELSLTHLIPAVRLTAEYLERYAEQSNRTWVLVLALHGMCPWSPISGATVPIRKAKAWLTTQAWRGPVQRIRWRGACGTLAGQALLSSTQSARE